MSSACGRNLLKFEIQSGHIGQVYVVGHYYWVLGFFSFSF